MPRNCAFPECTASVPALTTVCPEHSDQRHCGDCDEWYHRLDGHDCPEALRFVDEDEDDTPRCENCAATLHDDAIEVRTSTYNTQEWCDTCAERHASFCESCDAYRATFAPCDHQQRAAQIERYNFNPTTLTFHHAVGEMRDPARTEYVGLELEVAYNSLTEGQALTKLRALLEGDTDVYLKHDGSIATGRCGPGVELVTHPGSWRFWAQRDVRALWEYRLEQLRQDGFRSFDAQSCGLHFHVSRTMLTGTTLVRLQALIYDNQSLFKRISQRRNFKYCSFDRNDAVDQRYRVCKAGSAKYSMRFRNFRYNPDENSDRRVALNLPNDTPTVEFRFFRGTLHTPSFWKSFECVRACVEYARTEPLEAMLEVPFLHWVAAREREFPHLVAFLRRWYAPLFATPVHPRGVRTPQPQFADMLVNRSNEPLVGV